MRRDMDRRGLLTGIAAGAAALAAPRIVRAASRTTLTFVPQSDLAIVDPLWTTATVTRNHGYLVFDTLYGMDEAGHPQPQMVAGHTVENDGLTWTLTLRDGLRFHDGEPVRARDAVASIRRWSERDAFGMVLMQATEEFSARSDSVLQFRLKNRSGCCHTPSPRPDPT
jgi:peptide/nickel transport system substrate-binding protein